MKDTETRKAPKCRLFQWLHDFPEWKSAGSFEDQYHHGNTLRIGFIQYRTCLRCGKFETRTEWLKTT